MGSHYTYKQTIEKEAPIGDTQLPQEQINSVIRCFLDKQGLYKHGMFLMPINNGMPYYMHACSIPKAESASSTESMFIHADISELSAVSFFDESLDSLIAYSYSEEEGEGSDDLTAFSQSGDAPIEALKLSSDIEESILTACFSHWINKSDPVYIAIPDFEFDITVARFLKAAYMSMPYFLRARSGYITHPTPNLVPEHAAMCFLPESAKPKYHNFPVLTLNSKDCRLAIRAIQETANLDDDTVEYIRAKDRKSWHEFFFGGIEGMGDIESYLNLDPRMYGEMYVLHNGWLKLEPGERDTYIIDFLQLPKSQQNETTWSAIEGYLTPERLKAIVSSASECCNSYSSFAKAIGSLQPLPNRLTGLELAWGESLFDFALKTEASYESFQYAKRQLEELFSPQAIDTCEQQLIKVHEGRSSEEYEAVSNKLEEYKTGSLLEILSDISIVYNNIAYEDNKARIKILVQQLAEGLFITACEEDTKHERYDEISDAYWLIGNSLGINESSIDSAWDTYQGSYNERNESIAKLAGYINSEVDDVLDYAEQCLDAVRNVDMEDSVMESFIDTSLESYKKIPRKQTKFTKLIESDIKPIPLSSLYSKCCELSVFSDGSLSIILPVTNDGQSVKATLSESVPLIYWLITGEDQPEVTESQLWLAVCLAKERILNERSYGILLSGNFEGSCLELLFMVAARAELEGCTFTDADGNDLAPIQLLMQTAGIESEDAQQYKEHFMSIADSGLTNNWLESAWEQAANTLHAASFIDGLDLIEMVDEDEDEAYSDEELYSGSAKKSARRKRFFLFDWISSLTSRRKPAPKEADVQKELAAPAAIASRDLTEYEQIIKVICSVFREAETAAMPIEMLTQQIRLVDVDPYSLGYKSLRELIEDLPEYFQVTESEGYNALVEMIDSPEGDEIDFEIEGGDEQLEIESLRQQLVDEIYFGDWNKEANSLNRFLISKYYSGYEWSRIIAQAYMAAKQEGKIYIDDIYMAFSTGINTIGNESIYVICEQGPHENRQWKLREYMPIADNMIETPDILTNLAIAREPI
ncbi:MAG: OST-HTH/LOTUS domain-containing protein [Eubacteriaceae bacterium]|nr:OST-HTH/LOTUS domain-containing protein [Eubacteriaceae bacterium]